MKTNFAFFFFWYSHFHFSVCCRLSSLGLASLQARFMSYCLEMGRHQPLCDVLHIFKILFVSTETWLKNPKPLCSCIQPCSRDTSHGKFQIAALRLRRLLTSLGAWDTQKATAKREVFRVLFLSNSVSSSLMSVCYRKESQQKICKIAVYWRSSFWVKNPRELPVFFRKSWYSGPAILVFGARQSLSFTSCGFSGFLSGL